MRLCLPQLGSHHSYITLRLICVRSMSVNLITPPAYDARFERSRAEWPKRYHPLSRRRQASACFRAALSLNAIERRRLRHQKTNAGPSSLGQPGTLELLAAEGSRGVRLRVDDGVGDFHEMVVQLTVLIDVLDDL